MDGFTVDSRSYGKLIGLPAVINSAWPRPQLNLTHISQRVIGYNNTLTFQPNQSINISFAKLDRMRRVQGRLRVKSHCGLHIYVFQLAIFQFTFVQFCLVLFSFRSSVVKLALVFLSILYLAFGLSVG